MRSCPPLGRTPGAGCMFRRAVLRACRLATRRDDGLGDTTSSPTKPLQHYGNGTIFPYQKTSGVHCLLLTINYAIVYRGWPRGFYPESRGVLRGQVEFYEFGLLN